MAGISFGGFKDPIRRPRYIIWVAVAVLTAVAVMIPVLGVTSTRWFCTNGCHKVQDDTIKAYQHSSHANISCMACHMPVNANPVVFMMHKVEALGELYLTLTNKFPLPLNGEDEVSLTMKSVQCNQCHDESKRNVTPDSGLKMDHAAHSKGGVDCTICHNRIAHKEDFDLALKQPATREPNLKHENFMLMTACFRCHTQDYANSSKPSGTCETCHTPLFQLKPASHLQTGFFPKGHGRLGADEDSRTIRATGISWLNGAETSGAAVLENASSASKKNETLGQSLPKAASINACSTCHKRQFCIDCHGGLTMPHPQDWSQKHGAFGAKNRQTCQKCHGTGTTACDTCHHGVEVSYQYDPSIPWRKQHPAAVKIVGPAGCLKCHTPTYCALCHVNGGVPPK